MGLIQSSRTSVLATGRSKLASPLNIVSAAVQANRVPLVVFATHVLLVFVVGAVAVQHFYTLREVPAIQYRLGDMNGIAHYLIQPLRNWDGYWYSLLANYGYGIYQASAAFWPLYPFLIWFSSNLTGWDTAVTGILISNISFMFALILLYRLIQIDYPEPVARRAIWLTAFFPTAFYFSAMYTESLFLLATVAAVYYGRTDRWGRAAVAVALAALTRNTGILILIPLAVFLFRKHRWNLTEWWKPGYKLGIAALSPLLFMFKLDDIWGDPLLMLSAQKGWARYKAMPWTTLQVEWDKLNLTWLNTLIHSPNWSTLSNPNIRFAFAESQAYDLFIFLVFVPLLVYTLWRVRPAYSLYALVVFALPLFTPSHVHPLMSMPRFVIVLFPFFIAMAMLARRRLVFGALMFLFVIQLMGLLIQFSTWFWVA